MSTGFDPYYKWLAIPPEEQPPNHYRLLGLVIFESDPDVIDAASEARVAYLRNKQGGKNAAASQQLLNEVAAARIVLLSDEKRNAYDEHLRATTHNPLGPAPTAQPDPLAMAPAAQPAAPSATGFENPGVQTGIRKTPVRARKKPQPAWVLPAVLCGGALFVLTVVCIAAAAMLGGTGTQTVSADGSPPIPVAPRPVTPPPASPQPVDPAPVDPAPVDPPSVDPPPVDPPPIDPPPVDPPPVDPPPVDPPPVDPPPVDPPPVDPPAVPDPVKPGKMPVPSQETQQASIAKMRTLFDFDKADTPAAKLQLAGKLSDVADNNAEPVQQYVLLTAATSLAIEGGDAVAAVDYAGRLGERFEVDAVQPQYDLLMKAAGEFRQGPEIETLVKASAQFIPQALDADRVDLANDVAGETYKAAARRGVPVEARKAAFDQRNQVRDMFAAWKKVRDALESLKTSPDDPATNTIAGEYFAFTAGDWDRGLMHLAKSDDEQLQPVASLELNGNGSADTWKQAGDQWQQLAVQEDGDRKLKLLMRSARAYLIAQSLAPPGSETANALPPILAKFGDLSQVRDDLIRERRPDGKMVLFIGMGGVERKHAEPASQRYFLKYHFMKSMDPDKVEFEKYHTIMVGSNGMDYWGTKERKAPEAFKKYEDFMRQGGHLVVFGTYNGRNMEHLRPFGIRTGFQHGTKFLRNGEPTELFFRGVEHLVPESGKLRTAGDFYVSTPHTVLLKRDAKRAAVATLPVDDGRLTITTCEPMWMGDLWLIEAMVSWVANGTPLPEDD